MSLGAQKNGHVPDTARFPVTYVEIYGRWMVTWTTLRPPTRHRPTVACQRFRKFKTRSLFLDSIGRACSIPGYEDPVNRHGSCLSIYYAHSYRYKLAFRSDSRAILLHMYARVSADLTAYFTRSRANISRGN